MKLDGPRAQRHGVVADPRIEHVGAAQGRARQHVPRLARADGRPRRDQVRALVPGQRADRFHVRPRLLARAAFRGGRRPRVARVVRLIREKRDDLTALRKARHQPVFLGHVLGAARLRVAHRARPIRARHVGVARNPADPHRERTVLHGAVRVAVARRRARELREVGFAARIDERGAVEAERTGVVQRVRAAHGARIAFDGGEAPVQDHVDARRSAQPVERELHRLGLDQRDHDVGAARAHRPAHAAQTLQRGEHLGADTADGAQRRVGLRPEPAVRQHAAARRGAAEKRCLLEQCDTRAVVRRADRGGNARGAAAANHDVVALAALNETHHGRVAPSTGRPPFGCVRGP